MASGYQGMTIKELMQGIKDGIIVLPAIQRDFVWSTDKIIRLFDSLANGYPIGTFLYWTVRSDMEDEVVFNSFIDLYHEKKSGKPNRGNRVRLDGGRSYTGVLDGQQRITSLFLGLCGEFETHIKRRDWSKPSSFERSVLCMDLMAFLEDRENIEGSEEEERSPFVFALIPKDPKSERWEILREIALDEQGKPHYWMPMSDFMNKPENQLNDEVGDALEQIDLSLKEGRKITNAVAELTRIFQTDQAISFFKTEKDIWDVLDIFVRVNTGGQTLQASDLMLSIATATQGEDIQTKIQDAISDIASAGNDQHGFLPDKDLILRAALMFTDAESLYLNSKKNWQTSRIKPILDSWDDVVAALREAGVYLEKIGFEPRSLTSPNVVLPIAYYFYLHGIGSGSDYAGKRSEIAVRDGVFIRQWALRAMIKGIFGDSIPATLVAIRRQIKESFEAGETGFPLSRLIDLGGKKSLLVSSEDIDNLMKLRYGDARVRPLLMAISCGDPYSFSYQVDHMWPQSKFESMTKLKRHLNGDVELAKRYKQAYNMLPNLQLIRSIDNLDKSAKDYDEWLDNCYPNELERKAYFKRCLVPQGDRDMYAFDRFLELLEARERLLREAIAAGLPNQVGDINLTMVDPEYAV